MLQLSGFYRRFSYEEAGFILGGSRDVATTCNWA